jgi:hypothetical protein
MMVFSVRRIQLQETIHSIELTGIAIFDVITYVIISCGDIFERRVDDEYSKRRDTRSHSVSIREMNQHSFREGYNPFFKKIGYQFSNEIPEGEGLFSKQATAVYRNAQIDAKDF